MHPNCTWKIYGWATEPFLSYLEKVELRCNEDILPPPTMLVEQKIVLSHHCFNVIISMIHKKVNVTYSRWGSEENVTVSCHGEWGIKITLSNNIKVSSKRSWLCIIAELFITREGSLNIDYNIHLMKNKKNINFK